MSAPMMGRAGSFVDHGWNIDRTIRCNKITFIRAPANTEKQIGVINERKNGWDGGKGGRGKDWFVFYVPVASRLVGGGFNVATLNLNPVTNLKRVERKNRIGTPKAYL